jgi:hypothetical protein
MKMKREGQDVKDGKAGEDEDGWSKDTRCVRMG